MELLETFLHRWGAAGIFLVATLDGDVVLLTAGVLAHLGSIGIGTAIAACSTGMWAGDAGWYLLGRAGSKEFRETRFYRKVGPTIERLVGMLGPFEILTARFVYGTRYASMVYWGIQGMPAPRFLGINAAGCLAWSGLLVTLGFFMSHSVTLVLGDIRRLELWFLGTLALTAAVYFGARSALRRWHPKSIPNLR